MLELYTDGSCVKNPDGPGGWAVVLIDDDKYEWYLSDGEEKTTNNRMELRAVIEGIKLLSEDSVCKIYTDSKLVINCATGLWKRKANIDMWEEYDKIVRNKIINYEWVKGHNGNYYNEKVDKLALEEARKFYLKKEN
jgi:ribonuclease HI